MISVGYSEPAPFCIYGTRIDCDSSAFFSYGKSKVEIIVVKVRNENVWCTKIELLPNKNQLLINNFILSKKQYKVLVIITIYFIILSIYFVNRVYGVRNYYIHNNWTNISFYDCID